MAKMQLHQVSGSIMLMHSSANSTNKGSIMAALMALNAFSAESTSLRNWRKCLFFNRSLSASLLAENTQRKSSIHDVKCVHHHFNTLNGMLCSPNSANLAGSTVSSVLNGTLIRDVGTDVTLPCSVSTDGSNCAFTQASDVLCVL